MESEHSKRVDSEAENISLVNSEEEIPTDEQIAEILKMLEAYSLNIILATATVCLSHPEGALGAGGRPVFVPNSFVT